MSQLTGLFRRGTAYYLRIVLPNGHPLKEQLKCGRFVTSLGACSYREALLRGMLKRAEVLCGVDTGQPGAPSAAQRPAPAPVAAPSRPAPQPAALTLRQIHGKWIASKHASADTAAACLRAVALFETCFSEQTDVRSLTREQGDTFRSWLLTLGATSKTSRDRFTWVKALLNYAARDLEAMPKNQWEGLDIAQRVTSRRRPWTPDELRMLFGQALYTRYAIPTETKAGGEAAYWIPLIGLYTGARVSELAQLRVSDVKTIGPVTFFSISDEGDSQQVKTESSVRAVPVHPELVRLGLLDYVKAVKDSGSTSLWPSLRFRTGKPGGYFSAWFGDFRRSAGLVEANPDFHCLRHTVRTAMSKAGIDHKVQDVITGHKPQGSVGTRIYQHVSDEELVEAIAVLNYSGLALPRVYPVPDPDTCGQPTMG